MNTNEKMQENKSPNSTKIQPSVIDINNKVNKQCFLSYMNNNQHQLTNKQMEKLFIRETQEVITDKIESLNIGFSPMLIDHQLERIVDGFESNLTQLGLKKGIETR